MNIIILILIAAFVHSVESIIDVQTRKLTDLWTNGSFIPLKTNKDASVGLLVLEFQNAYRDANLEYKELKILDNKCILIPQLDGREYIAVLVEHLKGSAVIYFRYDEQSAYWWNKSFPIK